VFNFSVEEKERNAEASKTIIIIISLKKEYSLYSAIPQRNKYKKKILKKLYYDFSTDIDVIFSLTCSIQFRHHDLQRRFIILARDQTQ